MPQKSAPKRELPRKAQRKNGALQEIQVVFKAQYDGMYHQLRKISLAT